MSATIGKVYVDAVITDERYKECMALVQEADKRIDELRELVRVFYHCTTSGKCDECPINGGGPVHLAPDTICDTLHDRMRELGIEVDG